MNQGIRKVVPASGSLIMLVVLLSCLVEYSVQENCAEYFCLNGATCIEADGDACCTCSGGYAGRRCGQLDNTAVQCVSCSNGNSTCLCSDGSTTTESKCKCFPQSAMVQSLDVDTNQAMPKRMDELDIGDKVLTIDPTDYKVKYQYVYGFSHRDQNRVVEDYQNIKTSGDVGDAGREGITITASKGHLLWAATDTGHSDSFRLVPAADIKPGNLIMVPSHSPADRGGNGNAAVFKPLTVETTFTSQDVGVYSPHTSGGNIVVNGVVASCYTDVFPSHISHVLLWPARQSFHMMGNSIWFQTLDKLVFTNIIDIGRDVIEAHSLY